MKKRILVLGATSTIAQEACKIWAKQGCELFLVARNQEKLQAMLDDIKIRYGAEVNSYISDLSDTEQVPVVMQNIVQQMQTIDEVLIAYGTLPSQQSCEQSIQLTLGEINTNALSVIAYLTILANIFEQQKTGSLAVITSVAGDRGRASNYVYGCAKGMVSIFLSGLRSRLHAHGVSVVDIRPGFVSTQMTSHLTQKGLLWASPVKVAAGIVKAMNKQKSTVYLPGFWKIIMKIIKAIPVSFFNKIKI